MPLTKYTASTAIIAALADLPNATSGLTPAQLKAKFDENPEAFKVFVNSTLTAEIDALIASVAAGTGLSDGAVTNAKLALNAVTSDKIVDGTIVNADINAAAAIDGSKLANLSITSSQIADGTIVNADINASASIDASKIGTGVVSNAEFSYLDGVTQSIQTQINGVVLGSIPDGSLTDVKLSADPADIKARFTAHSANYANPHAVTAAQVGAPTIAQLSLATTGSKIYAYKNIGGF